MPPMKRLPTVMGAQHQFSQVPKVSIERSVFDRSHGHKTMFDAGRLIPLLVDWILPGDTFTVRVHGFARLTTLLKPLMDNMYWDWHFWFVPDRLVWANFQKFMGEQVNPGDSISFVVPQVVSNAGGYPIGSVFDYMGLVTAGQQTAGLSVPHSSLPLRAYNLVYNQWYRDENLINSVQVPLTDGPDANTIFGLATPVQGAPYKRGKRHDYFTSCLPFVQKGTAVTVPITGLATVKTNASALFTGVQPGLQILKADTGGSPVSNIALSSGTGGFVRESTLGATAGTSLVYPSNLYADGSTGLTALVNDLRLAFQTQKFLERDARGGTRYTEIIRSHFGVVSPDARLQRPEYLGGGSVPIVISPVAQTTQSAADPVNKKLGDLAALGSGYAKGIGFTKSFVEHGTLLAICSVRADLTYQQGLERGWSHSTRFDRYWPEFSHIGEQAVLNKEIFAKGDANDPLVFGYQERYAEYRYKPSRISGLFRSTAASTLEIWHLSEKFAALPVLGQTFIEDQTNSILSTRLAVTGQADFQADVWFDMKCARPMPVFGVPGFIDHF